MKASDFYSHPREMEPLFPSQNEELIDLAMDVHRKAAALGGALHKITRHRIADLLRHINSYYSNLIEGHHTHPADIERAARREYDEDPKKRALQQLNLAHIEVQKKTEKRLREEPNIEISSPEFLCWIHKCFYELVPDDFRRIKDPSTGEEFLMEPGKLRDRLVEVGNHFPPHFEALNSFMERFNEKFNPDNLHGTKKLVAVASSHHRLTWIHPFVDGNGRVARLFTHACMKKAQIDSHGLWTVSRGLARESEAYKSMLAHADGHRKGDYDGRGNLSTKTLGEFCFHFLETCLDQIEFMSELLDLDNLAQRIQGYVDLRSQGMLTGEIELKEESKHILIEVMLRGEISRADAKRVTGLSERSARRVLSALEDEELVTSESHRSPVRFNIPPKVVGYYFPDLYPEGRI
ncbi:MAG: Fic family protein [Balneolaceae bacterium]|nr:Fic family protein [Balneolaceae bacterium]